MLKRFVYFFAHGVFLVASYLFFLLSGRNTERGYQAMVYLFCHTGGRVNNALLFLDCMVGTRLRDVRGVGVIGDVLEAERLAEQVLDRGYFVKESALSQEVCDRLMDFAMSTPAVVRPMDGQEKKGGLRLERVDLERPAAVRYDYRVSDLLANPDVQDLLADPSLLTLAESYLGTAPKLDVLSMWWHFGFSDSPDSEAAQLYHFDLDRPRWLKVFIYLTDVGLENGPHSFIEGTHKIDSIPRRFLHRGYVRLSDAEVHAEYGQDREKVFTAPRGTVIAEDTIGLHKGGVVKGGARLILQLQFSSSLFGGIYPKANLPEQQSTALAQAMATNPSVYSGYH